MDPLVKLDNVAVVYNEGEGVREVTAISDISFEVYPKEYVILFGPSGCGKSTVLNAVAGLEKVSRGSVVVAGKDVARLNDEEMSMYHRHEMGFVFQAYNLIPTLSVGENIALPQMFDGVSIRNWRARAEELAARFGIVDQISKIPAELSGGQQQRVGVARALVNNPAIILADEPTGNLDSKNARLVLDIFQTLNLEENKTVLMVTHSPTYLSEADRVFYLRDGHIVNEVRNKKRVKMQAEEKEFVPVVGEGKKEAPVAEEKKEEGGERPDEKEKLFEKFPAQSEFFKEGDLERFPFTSEKVTEFALGIPREYTVKRIQEIVEDHLQGKTTGYEMLHKLDDSYFGGGAGLNIRSAARISHLVEHMLANADMMRRLEVQPSSGVHDETLSYLCESLNQTLNLKLSDEQRVNLKEIIKERAMNFMGPVKLRRMLSAPLEDGGARLRWNTVPRVSGYIELIILVSNYGK